MMEPIGASILAPELQLFSPFANYPDNMGQYFSRLAQDMSALVLALYGPPTRTLGKERRSDLRTHFTWEFGKVCAFYSSWWNWDWQPR